MNPPNRIPMLIGLAVGLLLIAYGLVQSSSGGDGIDGPSGGSAMGPAGGFTADLAGVGEAGKASAEDLVAPEARPAKSDSDRLTTLDVVATYLKSGVPAADASIGLWRTATGEGPSYRPARRLTELRADPEGKVQFTVPPDIPLELYGRARIQTQGAAGGSGGAQPIAGPVKKVSVNKLTPGESRQVSLVIERPPEPLELTIRDALTSEPIAGAAIRTVAAARHNLGLEDFPGTTQLEGRSDGLGIASLRGPVRKSRWLIVDAAGYAPRAIRPGKFDETPAGEARLEAAGSIEMVVIGADGQPAKDVTVRLIAALGEFRTTFTGGTNRRGEVSFRGLPVGGPLLPQADVEGEDTQPFGAVTLEPGEKRNVELTLR